MAATITRGATFTLGQQDITAAQFKTLLSLATIVNIDRDNVDLSAFTPATRQALVLSNPQALELWMDDKQNFIRAYVGTAWAAALAFGRVYTLSTTAARAALQGDVLTPSTSVFDVGLERMSPSYAGAPYRAMAVAVEDVALGGTGTMILHGPCKVRSTGVIAAGDGVRLSSTTGIVESAGSGNLHGPRIFGWALEAASGDYVWINKKR